MVNLNIDEKDLEKALSEKDIENKISKEEEIGYHKGALNTLVGERNELIKMIQNVETIMQMHLKRLQELGVKIQNNNKN